jgi:hypothetical protein
MWIVARNAVETADEGQWPPLRGEMALTFSRRLALFIGTITPLMEIIRRWHQLADLRSLPVWFDDVLLGAFLLYGAWRAGKDRTSGRPILAAAWGFMCGLAYYSFFGQLQHLGEADPSGVSPLWIVSVKGVGLALGIAGLITALQHSED